MSSAYAAKISGAVIGVAMVLGGLWVILVEVGMAVSEAHTFEENLAFFLTVVVIAAAIVVSGLMLCVMSLRSIRRQGKIG